MGKLCVRVAILTVLAALTVSGQGSKKTPARTDLQAATTIPAEYEIKTVLLSGQGLFLVHIDPNLAYPGPVGDSFQAFFQDHFGTRPRNPNRALPKIVIGFSDEDKIGDVIKAIDSVRVLPQIVVELEEGLSTQRIIVPPKPGRAGAMQVKPNPLTLIVAVDENKDVTLNNEQMGKLPDLSHLTSFLKDIFHERTENGVFRADTNEVEKTVFIKMPLDALGADLSIVVKALADAGASPIGLQTEDLADQRKEILEVPLAPPLTKKPTK